MNISIIIPTLNRYNDLKNTLKSIENQSILPFEIIIIDQSDNFIDIKKDFLLLNILQYKFEIKSSALARNYWIEKLSKNSEIVIFLDDDVILLDNFLANIIDFFNKNKEAKWWVANIESPTRKISLIKKIWFFLLTLWLRFNETFVTKWWFNVMPFKNPDNITNIEWTSWCWMFFRKSIINEWFRFENRFMKYSLMEDVFFSYAINYKYPNSLFFVPNIRLVHLESPASRIPNESKIYQNIIHRYYFVKKFNLSIFAYIWTIFIFFIFDIINYKKLSIILYYYNWFIYILKNKKYILDKNFNFNDFIFKKD